MSFTEGFRVMEEVVCIAWEMVGNGRRARDDGNEGFRLGIIRSVAVRPLCEESASGDEIRGRDIVMVAERMLVLHERREVRAIIVPMVNRVQIVRI